MLVNVNIVLSTLKSTDTQVGEWVNIMGYVEEVPRGLGKGNGNGEGRGNGMGEKRGISPVRIQAIMLWSAGGLRLGEYEEAVLARLKTDRDNGVLT